MNKGVVEIPPYFFKKVFKIKFPDPYTSNKNKISSLQHWVLVHSAIYYLYNDNVVSDRLYDMNCKQLVKLQNQFRKAFKESRYNRAFEGFDGSTGFYLLSKLKEEEYKKITGIAEYLISKYGGGLNE